MHTTYSDGTGSVRELAHAAREAGLRWIIITDHDSLEGQPLEGWIDGVLVIIDQEITPDRNHFLALNVDQLVDRALPPQDFVDAVYAQGGFGIIAHPDERVANHVKDIYRWDDWSVDGPRERDGRTVGIELWNFMSDWAESLTKRNQALLFGFPRLGLSGPSPETLAWWDALNRAGRRTFGVGGVDAHAIKKHLPWGEAEIFPYKWIFGTLTNYLLLDGPLAYDARTATDQVYAALAAGRSYFVNRLDGACPDPRFAAERAGATWHSGGTASIAGGPLLLGADVQQDAEVRIIKNGRVFARGISAVRATVAEAGVYRLEAYRKSRPWLYTNPIFVTD